MSNVVKVTIKAIYDNDLLYRKINGYHQIILPCKYKETVCTQLHMKMRYLSADRNLDTWYKR